MVGQEKLLSIVNKQIEIGEFPRFSIIEGPEGSGKKLLTAIISSKLLCKKVFIEPRVDAVREMIKNAYTIQESTLYVILDGNISGAAKESLLKICEETPKNAYICMLTSDLSMVSDTLKSRAGIYHIQPYTPKELLEYAQKGKECVSDADIIIDLCETPGDVNNLLKVGAEKFYTFTQKVVDNIADVSPANALKIAENIDTKGNDETKYDLVLFLRAFKSVCGKELRNATAKNDVEGLLWYSSGIKIVTESLNQLKITGINKSGLLDMFILNIRREWSD